MSAVSGDAELAPLVRRVLEAVAAAMGLDQGTENVYLGFENGRLRRWSRQDVNNGANELARYEAAMAHELRRLISGA
jgi:hypothetical protein